MSRRIKGKFYPLQADEWVETTKNLNYSEIKVLYYLRILAPSGDRFEGFSTREIADNLELSIRSVQRALNKLNSLGLIELQPVQFRHLISTTVQPKDEVTL